MQDHEQSSNSPSPLTRLRQIERELRALPRRFARSPQPGDVAAVMRDLEQLMTEYVRLAVAFVLEGGPDVLGQLAAAMEHHPPVSQLDFTRYSERTRRALYDAVLATHWDVEPEHPDDFVPDYSPDDAQLQVFFLQGRWFATWEQLEEAGDLPVSIRWEMLRIEADPSSPHGVSFTGV